MKSFVRSTMLATALVFAASTAQAQAAAESRFGVKAGIALPMGDFADGAGLGFHVGGHVGIPLKNALSLRIDADYGRYSGEEDVGIDNVGDIQPPYLWANNTLNANTDPGNFDMMGRYYFARVTVKF